MTALRDIGFAERPPIGLAVTITGQRFDLVGTEPYQRRDGTLVDLMVWHTNCATCGVGFTCKASPAQLPTSRRCEEHRYPGKAVSRKGDPQQAWAQRYYGKQK